MKKSVIGFPRIGQLRELKFATEKYFRKEISKNELINIGGSIKEEQWLWQKEKGINFIPSNDFSYYDGLLDLSVLLNVVPGKYRNLGLNELDTYFAMARGYQGEKGDVKALPMKKWFNTNYHYIVPEIDDETEIKLSGTKPFEEYIQAKNINIETKSVIIGGFTFLKLAEYKGEKKAKDFIHDISKAYIEILNKFNKLNLEWIQFDEPILVTDLSKEDIILFEEIYKEVLKHKGNVKVLLQTYFGDIRDCYDNVIELDFDGIGLDFIEGKKSLDLLENKRIPENKILFAGVINGKNIWKCNYEKTIELIKKIKKNTSNVVINTSCSLLHVPYTIENENNISEDIIKHFSFAKEKLTEINEIASLINNNNFENEEAYINNEIINKSKSNMEIMKFKIM